MDRVEAMKTLQGWTDTSVMHFHDLALSASSCCSAIRFGAWTKITEPDHAANWARYWRAEIQGYIHAYRAATGVDLTAWLDATVPAAHLRRRVARHRAVR